MAPPSKTVKSPPPTTPELPSRYQREKVAAASGGFGLVERVRDTFLDRIVVYKSMQDVGNNNQLLAEIQAIAKARSRHVVEIYDVIFDKHGQVCGIILEFLPGSGLEEFYKDATSDLPKYLRLIYQIATALNDIHAVGITHRDLKLANMRESSSGILKIFDFGLSTGDSNYSTVNNRGTFVYAAPDLYVPNATITREMDIYAFGVCAWALATVAFPSELLERPPQTSGRAPSISSVMPNLPVDVASAIDLCLHPLAAQRPQAKDISKLLFRELVRGQHRGVIVFNGNRHDISQATNIANVRVPPWGEVRIVYNGLLFSVSHVAGTVLRNNEAVALGLTLDGACLFTFGTRTWVPFFPSHPEVIL